MSQIGSLKSISNRLKNFIMAMAFVATQAIPFAAFIGVASAAASSNIDQCQNGTISTPTSCSGAAWVNGNANENNSHWREGDSLPYRVKFGGLTLGSHSVTIKWDTTKGGVHALDYITTFNRTEATADPCSGVSGCGSPSTFAIPTDTQVTGAGVTPVAGNLTLYNGTITGVSAYTYPDGTGFSGDKTAQLTVTFTASSATPVLAWAGHIASQIDWGLGNSASAVTGSPYHTSLVSLDGDSTGSQDRSLKASAVFPTPTIATQVSSSTVTTGQTVTDTATLTGPSNPLTGTVKFYLCGPMVSAAPCTTGGTQVGSSVALTQNVLATKQVNAQSSAVSATFTPQTAGVYCFRAEYAPAADAPYSPQNHTNSTTECFTAETPKGSITIVKDAIPNSSQDFSFTTSGLSTDQTGFKLDNDNDPTLSDTRAFNNLPAGDYTVTESATTGWDFDHITCTQGADVDKTAGNPTVTIHLAAGENVLCTYTNRERGTITVHKTTDPANDTTPFTITASTQNGDIEGSAVRNNLATNNSVVYDVSQGDYSVVESAKDGWIEDDSDCANLTVDSSNLNVECTIHNTKKATLVIVKDAVPNDAQDFSFTTTGTGLSPFSLDDDSDGTLSNSKSFTVAPGSYSVTEGDQSGWKLTGLTCDTNNYTTASNKVTVSVAAGQTTTCTFVNTKLGSLSGIKYEVNADGSTVQTLEGWIIQLKQGDTVLKSTTTDANGNYLFTDLLPGSYNIVEILQGGWTQIFSPDPVDLSAGETESGINFGNFENGSISGFKFEDKNGNGTFDSGEVKLSGWTIELHDSQDQLVDTDVTDSTGYSFTNLAPGVYKVCEVGQTNWTQTSTPTCYDVDIDTSGEQNLNINFGNQALGTITVKKNVDTDGDGRVDLTNASDWTWDLSGDYINDANFQNIPTGTTKNDLPVGAYNIHEDQKTDHHFVSVACSDESGDLTVPQAETTSVDLTVGKNIVCTFTNARDTGGLILKKHVVNDDGGTAVAGNFTLHVKQNGTDVTGSPAAGSETGTMYSGLVTGTYVVSEDEPLVGYKQTKIECDGQETDTVSVTSGQTKVCTITNDDIAPELNVIKRVFNDDGGTLWATDFKLYVNGVQQTDARAGGGDVNDSMVNYLHDGTKANVEYALTEDPEAGYKNTSLTCEDFDTKQPVALPVTLALAQHVRCTFVNEDVAPTLKLVKEVSGGTAKASDWALTATPADDQYDTLTGAGDSFGFQTARANLEYTLSESSNVTDYTAGDWSCVGGTLVGNKLTLDLDKDVTCTIVNTRDTGTVRVIKLLKPATDTGKFDLLINGPTDYTAHDQGDGGSTGTQTVDTGSYTVSETDGTSTDIDNYYSVYACYDGVTKVADGTGTSSTSFDVDKGHDIVCTFTNTRYGSISGTKYDANADSSTNGTLQGWTITLLVNGQPIATDTTDGNGGFSFDHLLPGLYGLVETLKDGWTQIFSPDSVDLAAGQNSTENDFGNFENGSISGYKFNDLNGNGTKDDGEPKLSGWEIELYDDQDVLLDSKETDVTTGYAFSNLSPGDYKVCEVGKPGWTQTTTPTCYTVEIDESGEINSAVFGNQARGSITVIKNVDNGFGAVTQDASGWTWDYDGTYEDGSNEAAGSTNTVAVAADSYTINEDQKTDYHFTSVVCTNDGKEFDVDQAESINFRVGAGDDIVCTFTNTRDTGFIRVTKHLKPKNDAGLFDLQINNVTEFTDASNGDSTEYVKVVTGESNFVQELAGTGTDLAHYDSKWVCQSESWELSMRGRGTVSDSFGVDKDQYIDCVFTNTRHATLTINKDALPNDPQWFEFTLSHLKKTKCEQVTGDTLQVAADLDQTCFREREVSSFELQDYTDPATATHPEELSPGWYLVSEVDTLGWVLTDLECGDSKVEIDGSNVLVRLSAGDQITCTYTNTKLATVTVVKDARPDSSQAFHFTTSLGDSFTLTDNGVVSTNSKTFTGVMPGTYVISEESVAGWRLHSINCGEGTQISFVKGELSLVVEPGANVTCTFVNTKVQGHVLGAELVNTGNDGLVNILAGSILISLALAARWFGRKPKAVAAR